MTRSTSCRKPLSAPIREGVDAALQPVVLSAVQIDHDPTVVSGRQPAPRSGPRSSASLNIGSFVAATHGGGSVRCERRLLIVKRRDRDCHVRRARAQDQSPPR